GIPIRVATSTTVKPRSRTCFTVSARNSSVYCLLLINTSAVAMNYGLRVSTKGWPVHGVCDGRETYGPCEALRDLLAVTIDDPDTILNQGPRPHANRHRR